MTIIWCHWEFAPLPQKAIERREASSMNHEMNVNPWLQTARVLLLHSFAERVFLWIFLSTAVILLMLQKSIEQPAGDGAKTL